MAKPIEPTPTLDGDDAEVLRASLDVHASKEEMSARRTRARALLAEMTRPKSKAHQRCYVVPPRHASGKLRKLMRRAERAWRYSDESKVGADGWLRRCRKAGWEYLNPGTWATWKGSDTRLMEGDR